MFATSIIFVLRIVPPSKDIYVSSKIVRLTREL